MGDIIIRPSGMLKYESCPAAYKKQYIDGWRTDMENSNLIFGTTVHSVCNEHLHALVEGKELDTEDRFVQLWEEARASNPISYNSTMDGDDLQATGAALCAQFPKAWADTGLSPAFDEDGPLLERRFEVSLGHGVRLSCQPDVVAMNGIGELVIPDFKTPASPSSEDFTFQSDQLTLYQVAVEANYSEDEMPRVGWLGFLELLKKKIPKTSRGAGPVVAPMVLSPARTKDEQKEVVQKVLWMADDIRRGRFPKRPGMAWNTPCDMCDFRRMCMSMDRDTTGLCKKADLKLAA